MKTLTLLLSFACLSCVSQELKSYRAKVTALDPVSNRKGLYAALPPVELPTVDQNPYYLNGMVGGHEWYRLDERYILNYSLAYRVVVPRSSVLLNIVRNEDPKTKDSIDNFLSNFKSATRDLKPRDKDQVFRVEVKRDRAKPSSPITNKLKLY